MMYSETNLAWPSLESTIPHFQNSSGANLSWLKKFLKSSAAVYRGSERNWPTAVSSVMQVSTSATVGLFSLGQCGLGLGGARSSPPSSDTDCDVIPDDASLRETTLRSDVSIRS